MPIAHLPTIFQPSVEEPLIKKSLWLLPFLLALVFIALTVFWAEAKDAQDREAFHNTLLADIQSVDAQFHARQEMERTKLRDAAARLGANGRYGDAELSHLPEVVAGMDRLWNRLIWIGEDAQVHARATRSAPPANTRQKDRQRLAAGQTDHFVAQVQTADAKPAGRLLARYDITDFLHNTDLAWLNQRYLVEFLSELGEVIATTAEPGAVAQGTPTVRPLTSFPETTLRLTPYDAQASWRRNSPTLTLLAALLLLGAAASQLLRLEMAQVRRAIKVSQTEAAWRQSMEDSALVGLRARDLNGRILYVNKTLCDMVCYSQSELVGLIPPLPFWPPNAIDGMMEQNMNTLAGDTPSEGFETRWQKRNGEVLDVMIFESPLVNTLGERIGWMGSIVDISVRKRLQEQERNHLEAMAQHARLNDIGLIASELAHELNQPLATIASYSLGLQKAISARLPQERELLDALAALQRSEKKASEIVNWIHVQAKSKIAPGPGQRGLQYTEVDLNALVIDSLEQRKRQIDSAQIQVKTQLQRPLPQVLGDRIGLEQLISNLVRNAADALSHQRGLRTIRVQTQCLAIADAAATPDEDIAWVEIRVGDNGPGLGGRTLDMLCTTFYSTKSNGLGLGLGICRAIAESHGGKLQATSGPDGGAEFRLLLPLTEATSQEQKQ